MRRFDTRTATVALGASASAIAVARLLHGDLPDFHLPAQPLPSLGTTIAHLVLSAILWTLDIADTLVQKPSVIRATIRAGVVGALAGLLAWFAPHLVGGGDALAESVLLSAGGMAAIFLLRFAFGPLSYAAGTPGGLFAPMLVLGAQTGLVFGRFFIAWFPSFAPAPGDTGSFAAVGMAAFFTAVVRAPLTGIVLVMEMTASFSLLLPMLAACFTAMTVPALLRCPPVYDPLGARAARSRTPA